MEEAVLERHIRRVVDSEPGRNVTIAWQGHEPMRMGLEFFRRAVAYERQYARPGMTFRNTFHTDGTLLDDDWCRFFWEHRFRVIINLDGPRALHDGCCADRGAAPTFDAVMRGLDLLRKHRVDCQVLTTIYRANLGYPLEVYRFLRDELQATRMKFVPAVERKPASRFLRTIFEEWVSRDVGSVFVRMFQDVLTGLARSPGLQFSTFATTEAPGER